MYFNINKINKSFDVFQNAIPDTVNLATIL